MAKVEIEAEIKREDDMCVSLLCDKGNNEAEDRDYLPTELSIERRGKLIDCEAAAGVGVLDAAKTDPSDLSAHPSCRISHARKWPAG